MASNIRSKKLFLNVLDDRFSDRRQSSIIASLTDGTDLFTSSYAKVFTEDELGSFDVVDIGGENVLKFVPLDGRINEYNYSFITYDIKRDIEDSTEVSIGNIVSIATSYKNIGTGTVGTITKIPTDFTSAKILVEISTSNNFYEYTELSVALDKNINDVAFSEFGQLVFDNDPALSGLGTYDVYVSGSHINVDFYPDHVSLGEVITNTVSISFASTSFSGDGNISLRSGNLESTKTGITSSISPIPVVVGSYDADVYQASYIISQVVDTDTNQVEILELFVINSSTDSNFIEYGNTFTSGFLGNFDTRRILSPNQVEIVYTPDPGRNVEVTLFQNVISYFEFSNFPTTLNLENSAISSGLAIFGSADKTRFDLKYKGDFIFEKLFRADFSSVVNLSKDSITIPNHFFVTGEKVQYRSNDINKDNTFSSIGIALTTINGVGLTDKLSGDLYVYKVDSKTIKLSTSAENSLSTSPKFIDFTSLGIGKTHYITSTNQNQKCIIAIDNVIQSPIYKSSVGLSTLQNQLLNNSSSSELTFLDVDGFSSGDFIQIENEIMKINSVDAGSSLVFVNRGVFGTGIESHAPNSIIEKIEGNYNIVGSTIFFGSAPYGETISANEFGSVVSSDQVKSSFQGRVFIRSGIPDSNIETYEKNYLFDDISEDFNAVSKDFTLKNNGNDILGISTDRSIILINNILQIPENDFTLTENLTNTQLNFTGTATSVSYDANNSSVPRGGIPVSIASSNGFGYQPLVAAGGTAIVSFAGTISSVSIGNSGSGYRVGIQPTVRVGVQTYSSGIPNIEFIGTATVQNGGIVGVSITNPGSGYTSTNPPDVVFDYPLSYSGIPLIYSPSYFAGFGTEAKIDIVVGQGSSVVDFTITNYGYSYRAGDILTVETGDPNGIPLDSTKTFQEFSIIIDKVTKDNFSGWYVGGLKLLDNFSTKFDGKRKVFFLTDNGNIFSIISKKGSEIDVKATILIFLNDVLQVPDESYTLSGGSRIVFTEAPKEGDECKVIFYRGTDGIDVVDVDIEDTIKEGDTLQIVSNNPKLSQESRIVDSIFSPNAVDTNLYSSIGISSNFETVRPVAWCKQTEDFKINGVYVTKNRVEYEPRINPVSSLIKSVGIGSTMIFVNTLSQTFDYKNENALTSYIDQIEIIENVDKKTAVLSAVVSTAGTITSVNILDSGSGYLDAPSLTIASPIGIGTTGQAQATTTISSGSISSISITNPGFGYTTDTTPLVIVETPNFNKEYIKDVRYSGDFGIISGITTTSVGYALTGLVFQLLIPSDSPLRDSKYTNPTITQSSIKDSYYFEVFNSNVGNGVVSLDETGNVVGIGTLFLDNVYKVLNVSNVVELGYSFPAGFPVSMVEVTVSLSSYNGLSGIGKNKFFGEFTWGLIEAEKRSDPKEFVVDLNNGVVGLNSSPTVKRVNPLKNNSYTVV